MVLHSEAVACVYDGVAVHHPSGIAVHVGIVGDVGELTGSGVYDCYVIVGVALVHVYCGGKPFAVGRPVKGYASVAGCVGLSVGEESCLACLQVHDSDLVAVLNECHELAVG